MSRLQYEQTLRRRHNIVEIHPEIEIFVREKCLTCVIAAAISCVPQRQLRPSNTLWDENVLKTIHFAFLSLDGIIRLFLNVAGSWQRLLQRDQFIDSVRLQRCDQSRARRTWKNTHGDTAVSSDDVPRPTKKLSLSNFSTHLEPMRGCWTNE